MCGGPGEWGSNGDWRVNGRDGIVGVSHLCVAGAGGWVGINHHSLYSCGSSWARGAALSCIASGMDVTPTIANWSDVATFKRPPDGCHPIKPS
jgi:hypothetical protein